MSDVFSVAVDRDPTGRVCVITLTGKLDPVAAEELQPVVDRLLEDGHRDFVLDLSGLPKVP